MRHVRLVMSVLFAILLAAACSDAPTAPTTDAVSPAGPSSTFILEPLIVVGKCDPIMSIDWCGGSNPGGGDCMTSRADSGLQYTSGCGGGGGGGGGDGGTPSPIPPGGGGGGSICDPLVDPACGDGSTCDPLVDPACYKPLTRVDSATIAAAFARYLRDPASIADPTARQGCETMTSAFNTLYANGRVHRGGSTTTPGDGGVVPHTGAWDPNAQKMHVDPKYLDRAALGGAAAMRELLDTLLHEAAHALNKDHPNGYVSSPWGPVFSDPYFDLLSPGARSCIAW